LEDQTEAPDPKELVESFCYIHAVAAEHILHEESLGYLRRGPGDDVRMSEVAGIVRTWSASQSCTSCRRTQTSR
jgi:hypothetical protein